MWKVRNQTNDMVAAVSGIFVTNSKNGIDHRYQVKGYLQGTAEQLLLGYYSPKGKAQQIMNAAITQGVNGNIYTMPGE